jgi:hypothetical protein
MKRSTKAFIFFAVSALIFVNAVVVWAFTSVKAESSNENVIYACLNPAGQIRIVDSLDECRPKETPIQWNIVGPAGNPGPQGEPGLDGMNCWDINGNGIADPAEDRNGDGQVDVLDCEGEQGIQGIQGPEGEQGVQGNPGLACWDLNGNGEPDLPDEDTNGDGVVNILDCKGEDGDPGSQGPAGPPGPAGQGFELECEQNQVVKYNAYAECWQCADEGEVVGESQGFTASSTFTVPEGITRILVEVWGAGGGGGYPSSPSGYGCRGAGGGGGSGGYSKRILDVVPGQVFSIVIGAGGSPVQKGDDSSVTDTSGTITPVIAGGGKGGNNGTSSTFDSIGGAGGIGGSGETLNGNNGGKGGDSGPIPFGGCMSASGGHGGSAVVGTTSPTGSGGSNGGNGGMNPSSPGSGHNGYSLIRW